MNAQIDPVDVGSRIKTLRTKKGLTQKDLAALLHVSDKAVSKWERGECFPDLPLLPTLSRLFGLSVDSLLGLEAPPQPEKTSPTEEEQQAKSSPSPSEAGKKLRKAACLAAALSLLGLILGCLLEMLLASKLSLRLFLHFPAPILLLLGCFFYSHQEKQLLNSGSLPESPKQECRSFLWLFTAELLLLFAILAYPLGPGNVLSQWPYGLSSQLLLLALCLLGVSQIWAFLRAPSGHPCFQVKLWAGGFAALLAGAGLMLFPLFHMPELESLAQAEFHDPVYLNSDVATIMTRDVVEKALEQLAQQQNRLLLLLLGLALLYHLLLLLDQQLRKQPWSMLLMLLASFLVLLLCSQSMELLLGGESSLSGKLIYAIFRREAPAFAVLLLWSCGLRACSQRKPKPPAKKPLSEAADV